MTEQKKLTASTEQNLTRRVLKALGVFGGVQCVSIVCSLVRAKLIAIWIGPIGVGLFGIFNSVLDMLSNATQLNLRQSSVREISDSDEASLPHIASSVRWWARNLGFVGALIMLMASPLLSWLSFGDNDYWWAFAWLSVPMFTLAMISGEQAIMQGAGQLKQLAKTSLIGVITGTVISVPLYYLMGESSIIPSIFAFALASFAAVMMFRRVPSVSLSRKQHFVTGMSFLRLGIYMTISSLAATAASYAFLSYLNHTTSTTVTGIYQAGYTMVVKYMGLIFTAIAVEYYPRLVKVIKVGEDLRAHVRHEAKVLLWIVVPALLLFIALAPWLVRLLYSEEFMPVLPMVMVGATGVIFRVFSYCYSYVILAKGDGKAFVWTEVTSAAVGLTLNIVLFKLWGMLGLGVAYLAWYVIYAVMVRLVCRVRYGV